MVELLFADVPQFKTPIANNEQIVAKVKPNKQYQHVEVGNARACKDTSLGKIMYKKVGDIYTQTDKNDVYHVSDKPPEKGVQVI